MNSLFNKLEEAETAIKKSLEEEAQDKLKIKELQQKIKLEKQHRNLNEKTIKDVKNQIILKMKEMGLKNSEYRGRKLAIRNKEELIL